MISFLALAATTVMAPPVPRGDPASWITPELLHTVTGSGGTTVFDLMIDSTGQPVSCVVTQSSGMSSLDRTVCIALVANARFKAAIDETGAPAPGVWSDNVRWVPQGVGDSYYKLPPADIVSPMPSGVTANKAKIEAVVAVNADGSIAQCGVVKPTRHELLNATACALVAEKGKVPPVRVDRRAKRTPLAG